MNKIYIVFAILAFVAFSCMETTDSNAKKKKAKDGFGEEVVMKTYPDSSKMITYRVSFNDSATIIRSYYHNNGNLYKQGTTVHGKKEGEWKAWNEKGNLLTTGNYKLDLMHGYQVVYFENGNKRYDGYFKNGDRVGKWRFYNDKGEFVKEIDYDKK